jgi:hypothetical protein
MQFPTSHSLLPCATPYSYSNRKTVGHQKQQTASQASGQWMLTKCVNTMRTNYEETSQRRQPNISLLRIITRSSR